MAEDMNTGLILTAISDVKKDLATEAKNTRADIQGLRTEIKGIHDTGSGFSRLNKKDIEKNAENIESQDKCIKSLKKQRVSKYARPSMVASGLVVTFLSIYEGVKIWIKTRGNLPIFFLLLTCNL